MPPAPNTPTRAYSRLARWAWLQCSAYHRNAKARTPPLPAGPMGLHPAQKYPPLPMAAARLLRLIGSPQRQPGFTAQPLEIPTRSTRTQLALGLRNYHRIALGD